MERPKLNFTWKIQLFDPGDGRKDRLKSCNTEKVRSASALRLSIQPFGDDDEETSRPHVARYTGRMIYRGLCEAPCQNGGTCRAGSRLGTQRG